MNFKKTSSIACDIGLIVCTTLLIFFFIPQYMIILSPSDYSHINKLLLIKTSTVYAGIYLILFLFIYWILYLFKLKKTARFVCVFLFYWIVLSGFLFPLIQSSGMQDPVNTLNNKLHLFLVLSLSILFSVMLRTKFKRITFIFTLVFYHYSLCLFFINRFPYMAVKVNMKILRDCQRKII